MCFNSPARSPVWRQLWLFPPWLLARILVLERISGTCHHQLQAPGSAWTVSCEAWRQVCSVQTFRELFPVFSVLAETWEHPWVQDWGVQGEWRWYWVSLWYISWHLSQHLGACWWREDQVSHHCSCNILLWQRHWILFQPNLWSQQLLVWRQSKVEVPSLCWHSTNREQRWLIFLILQSKIICPDEVLSCIGEWSDDSDPSHSFLVGPLDYLYRRTLAEKIRCFIIRKEL